MNCLDDRRNRLDTLGPPLWGECLIGCRCFCRDTPCGCPGSRSDRRTPTRGVPTRTGRTRKRSDTPLWAAGLFRSLAILGAVILALLLPALSRAQRADYF